MTFSEAVAESELLSNRLSVLPSLNGNANHNYNYGRSVDPLTYEFVNEKIESGNFGLNSSLTLFGGFQKINAIQQAKYQLLADKSNIEKAKNDITLAVITSYLQILYSEDLVTTSKSQVELSQLQLERARKSAQVGNLTTGDVLEIESQLAREELNLTTAQNQLDLSYLNLVQLLDLDPAQPFSIERPAILDAKDLSVVYSPKEIYATAQNTLPDIKLADYNFMAARAGYQLAKGSLSPRLSLNGGINSGYSSGRQQVSSVTFRGFDTIGVVAGSNEAVLQPVFSPNLEKSPFKTQIDENLNQFIGFSLTVPIFNGWQARAGIRRAKLNMQNAEINAQIARNNLNKTINQAVADMNAAQKRYLAAKNSLEALQEAFKYTEQKFNVGLLNTVEYNIAKNNLARAELDFLQAKYDLVFKSKTIDFYLGKELTF